MKWEYFDLHIENILPGFISFTLMIHLLPVSFVDIFKNGNLQYFIENDFIAGSIFVTSSYIVGIIIVSLSRLVFDRFSELLPRPVLIRIFSGGKLKSKKYREINEDYRIKIKYALKNADDIVKKEIIKRRERGRMVRNTFFPISLAIWSMSIELSTTPPILYVIFTYVILLFIYAYVESSIYEECLLS